MSYCQAFAPSTAARGLMMYDLYDHTTAGPFKATTDPYYEFPLSPYESREVNSFTVQRLVSVYPFSGIFAELHMGSAAANPVPKAR